MEDRKETPGRDVSRRIISERVDNRNGAVTTFLVLTEKSRLGAVYRSLRIEQVKPGFGARSCVVPGWLLGDLVAAAETILDARERDLRERGR